MPIDRRSFLARLAHLSSLAALSAALPAGAVTRNTVYPFQLGVASGSPRPNGMVLWTRLIGNPLQAELFSAGPLAVRWEVAEDEGFRQIVARGSAAALPELAHSIHVDIDNLKPDRWYWYRFMHGDAISPVGRTRTAPAADALPASMRFAFASCQHWEFGHYAAHRHMAAANPDLVAFLGDYIYEWGPYDLTHPASPRGRHIESATLAEYRMRYAQYKTDPHLQALHHAAPWIVTWDDHEIYNDYGNNPAETGEASLLARRAAAYQAFYEHMPVRLSVLPSGPQRFAHLRMYERYDWGRLARFHVLDDRQYRSPHPCQPGGQAGSSSVTPSCTERLADSRSMLGSTQEKWLNEGFASSQARWNILAQQTLMAQHSQIPLREGGRFWTDGWDGYPAARTRLLESMQRNKLSNPLVIAGDVHAFYATELRPDFNRPASGANPVLATEFCGTSVTSSSRPQSRTDRYMADNPHIKYGRSDRRGFVMMEVSTKETRAHFRALDDVGRDDSGVSTVAGFVVQDGRPGVFKG